MEEQCQDQGMPIRPDKIATGMLVSLTFANLFVCLAAKEDIFTYFKCGVSVKDLSAQDSGTSTT